MFVALSKAFKFAVRHRYCSATPCTGTELPKDSPAAKFTARFLTPEEVVRLSAELTDCAPYDLLVGEAAYTGLRAGELAGLQIADVNLLRRELSVRRTVMRVKGGWVADAPKSARSSRTVPLLDRKLVGELEDYLSQHPRRHAPTAPLWPGREPGTHRIDWSRPFDHASFYRWYFKPALARAGLAGTRFHDLRHTYASMMLAAGVEPYKVSRWMGHANLATTDAIYAHLYNTDHDADAARVSDYLARQA